MLRRYHASPSKDRIRRRLFDSPKKNGRFLPPDVKRPTLVRSLVAVAVLFLVGVHLFLFRNLVFSSSTKKFKVVESKKERPTIRKSSNEEIWPPKDLRPLTPLRERDLEQYTIRMNTWRRPEQLVVSVNHHSSCEGVAQIQVVWCDKENEPPPELYNNSKVVIERHEENSLNERFRILSPTPTLGILSIDDDALRPCEALDDGFFKWTRHPDRMIGFDARVHVENEDGSWKVNFVKGSLRYIFVIPLSIFISFLYLSCEVWIHEVSRSEQLQAGSCGFMNLTIVHCHDLSTMEKSNSYSLSLTRYCFIHKDYLDMYMNALPASILDNIAEHFNCEDIAMSFMISSLTEGKPSLLADLWAIKSMVKLYVEEKISGGKSHKSLRDECVNNFAEMLGLKDGPNRLRIQPYRHEEGSLFECGDIPDVGETHPKTEREKKLDELKDNWHKRGGTAMLQEVKRLMSKTGFAAYQRGKTVIYK